MELTEAKYFVWLWAYLKDDVSLIDYRLGETEYSGEMEGYKLL